MRSSRVVPTDVPLSQPRQASRRDEDRALSSWQGDLVLVLAEKEVSAYAADNLFLLIWRGSVTDSALEAVHAAMARTATQHREGIGIVCVIEDGATPPNAAQRSVVREFQARFADRIRCLALVVDGIGFWVSMVLAVATSILSARQARFPRLVCRTGDEAAVFVAGKLQGTLWGGDPEAVRQAIRDGLADARARASS